MTGMSTPLPRNIRHNHRCEGHVRTREHGESDHVCVFVDGSSYHRVDGLEQAKVYHLEAGIAEGTGYDLGPRS